ncbi:MAG TPA: hypothetical protein ENH09_03270 [Bacteroidetes bacterium]|nr:hypothetical protein [Bacteroidota bacterium]
MLGILDDVKKMVTAHFKNPGDIIFLAGENKGEIGGSEYLQIVHHKVSGDCPSLGLPEEKNLQEFLVEAAELGLLQSAHDISEGGLAVALAESCILNSENRPGAITEFSSPIRPDFLIFGEDQSRAILSVKPEKADEIRRLAEKYTVPTAAIGIVTKQPFQIYLNERLILEADINELSKLYESAIEEEMIL